MMELTIKGKVYKFNFGMGFLREINKTAVTKAGGMEKNVGFRYAVGNIVDNEPETLVDVLFVANKGQEPRITKEELDEYIDDESTDIEGLFESVLDFLKKANATRIITNKLLEAVLKAMVEENAEEEAKKQEEAKQK